MKNVILGNNIIYLEKCLKNDYSIVAEILGVNYVITFKHINKIINLALLDSCDGMAGDGDIKISKLINVLSGELLIDVISPIEAEIIGVLRIYLEHNVLSTVFEKINIDLGEPISPEEEKVEYVTKNVRYLDYVNMSDTHNELGGIDNIFKNLNRLSILQVPVVEIGLGLRCNNYDDLNDYLILDTIDSELDSQLVNDNQALYLLNLQQLLEEYNVKSNGLTDGVYDRIKYCIPAYFKVTIKIKQE